VDEDLNDTIHEASRSEVEEPTESESVVLAEYLPRVLLEDIDFHLRWKPGKIADAFLEALCGLKLILLIYLEKLMIVDVIVALGTVNMPER
jgi:hypothetical protein